MRRLALLAVLVLVAAGCGGGGGKSSSKGDGQPAGNPIARTAAKTSRAGTVKADFEITGKGIHGGGRGVFETGSNGSGRIAMTVVTGGQSTALDTIIDGNVLYIRTAVFQQALPAGKEWVRLDLAKFAKQQGLNLGSLVDSNPTPTGALAYLQGSTGKVEDLGKEKVKGVETTHYRAVINLEQAAKRAKGATKQSLRRVIDVAGVKKLPVDVWVGDDGYVHKVIYRQYSGKNQWAKITMELYDFGSAVTITSPPASTVLDFQKLLGPQGS